MPRRVCAVDEPPSQAGHRAQETMPRYAEQCGANRFSLRFGGPAEPEHSRLRECQWRVRQTELTNRLAAREFSDLPPPAPTKPNRRRFYTRAEDAVRDWRRAAGAR